MMSHPNLETVGFEGPPWDRVDEYKDGISDREWLDHIWVNTGFSAGTKEAAYALSMYFRYGSRICWPSLSQLWNACGNASAKGERMSERLTPLVDSGWLERERRWKGARAPYVYGMRAPWTKERVLDALDLYEQVKGPFMSPVLAAKNLRP
jgi:hypothetical protein